MNLHPKYTFLLVQKATPFHVGITYPPKKRRFLFQYKGGGKSPPRFSPGPALIIVPFGNTIKTRPSWVLRYPYCGAQAPPRNTRLFSDIYSDILSDKLIVKKSENFTLLHASTNESIFASTGPLAEVSQRGHCILT